MIISIKRIVLAGLTCAGLALHAQNLIVNGSFETANFTGWTVAGNLQVANWQGASNGTWAVVLNGGESTPNGVLAQTFATIPGAEYQVSFDYGAYGWNSGQSLAVLVAGLPSAPIVAKLVTIPSTGGWAGGFTTFTLTFTATSTSSSLIFQDQPTNGTIGQDGMLDNISVVRLIPPPVLVLPKNITEEAESAAGAEVEFRAKATASVDGKITITYSKASESIFPVGITTVTVTATDAAGNKTVGTFTVTVTPKPAKGGGDDKGKKSDDDQKSSDKKPGDS